LNEQEIVAIGHPIKTVRAGKEHLYKLSAVDAVGTKAFASTKTVSMSQLAKAERPKASDFEFDADLENADWTKQTWDLPPYKSPQFNALGFNLKNFRKLPVYKHAVANGLIRNDTWVGVKNDLTV
jgi:hypothetical protein